MNVLFLVSALWWLCAGCGAPPDPAVTNFRESPPAAAQEAAAEGDVTGAYFFKGAAPAGFSEIEHLSLATIDENGRPAPLNGFIRPKRRSAKDYRLVNPELDGRILTFKTETVGGVSYSFSGTFARLADFAADPPPSDEVVLKGRLTKTRGAQVLADADVEFTYSAGG